VETITFPCPSCQQQLQFAAQSAGLLFRCPACGATGTLPEPVKDDLELEPKLLRVARKARKKAWRRVRWGLLLIVMSWGVVTLVVTLVVLALLIQFLGILFDREGTEAGPGPAMFGSLGLVLFLAEFPALAGYALCLAAPADAGVRGWAWTALGVACPRNLLCLIASILAFTSSPASPALQAFTTLAVCFFLVEWLASALLARAVAHAHFATWLLRNLWNGMFLAAGTLLGWLVLGLMVLGVTRSLGTAGRAAELLGGELFLARVAVGCGGGALCVLLWVSVAWHLRSLFRVWGLIENA
jgi:hypothetical protein